MSNDVYGPGSVPEESIPQDVQVRHANVRSAPQAAGLPSAPRPPSPLDMTHNVMHETNDRLLNICGRLETLCGYLTGMAVPHPDSAKQEQEQPTQEGRLHQMLMMEERNAGLANRCQQVLSEIEGNLGI